ncbi:Son of sevenless 1 [Paramecium bursaria]
MIIKKIQNQNFDRHIKAEIKLLYFQQILKKKKIYMSEEIEKESLAILFIILSLLTSIISQYLTKRTALPYQTMQLFLGVIFGLVPIFPVWTEAKDFIIEINPKDLLEVFIPILLTTKAYQLNIFSVRDKIVSVLLLCYPCLIINLCMIACIGAWLEFSWIDSFILATILTATDSNYIIQKLKKNESNTNLTSMISMESLSNNCSGLMLFNMFYQIKVGKNSLNEILFFVINTFCGIGIGVAFGIAVIFCLKILTKGQTLFLHTFFFSSYAVYFISAQISFAEGLYAVVGLGLVFNKYMKNMMTQQQYDQSEEIIDYILFLYQTVLYFFVGTIIGYLFKTELSDYISSRNNGILLLIFLGLQLIKLFSTLLLYPMFNHYGVTLKELIFISFTSTRGTLSIVMALIVNEDLQITSRSQILYFTCGIVLLSMINKLFSMKLFDTLKLQSNTMQRKTIKKLFFKQIKHHGQQVLESIKRDRQFHMAAWVLVEDIIQFDMLDKEKESIQVFRYSMMRSQRKIRDDMLANHRFKIIRHMIQFVKELQFLDYFNKQLHEEIIHYLVLCNEQPYKQIDIVSKFTERVSRDTQTDEDIIDSLETLDTLENLYIKSIKIEQDYNKHNNEYSCLPELYSEEQKIEEYLQILKIKYPKQLYRAVQILAGLELQNKLIHQLAYNQSNLIELKESTSIKQQLMNMKKAIVQFYDIQTPQTYLSYVLKSTFQELLDNRSINNLIQVTKLQQQIAKQFIRGQQQNKQLILVIKGTIYEKIVHSEFDLQVRKLNIGDIAGLLPYIDSSFQSEIYAQTDCEYAIIDMEQWNVLDTKKLYKKALPLIIWLFKNNSPFDIATEAECKFIAQQCKIVLGKKQIVPFYGAMNTPNFNLLNPLIKIYNSLPQQKIQCWHCLNNKYNLEMYNVLNGYQAFNKIRGTKVNFYLQVLNEFLSK